MMNNATTQARIVDWDEALRLANNNHDLAKEMLQMLAERLPDDLQDIVNAFTSQNFDEAKQLTHKLRGALCYCGVPRLRGVVEGLDNELKMPDDLDKITNMLGELKHEVTILMDVVRSM